MTFLSHDGARSERKGKFVKSLNNTLLLFMNLGSITMEQAKIKAEASITNISWCSRLPKTSYSLVVTKLSSLWSVKYSQITRLARSSRESIDFGLKLQLLNSFEKDSLLSLLEVFLANDVRERILWSSRKKGNFIASLAMLKEIWWVGKLTVTCQLLSEPISNDIWCVTNMYIYYIYWWWKRRFASS